MVIVQPLTLPVPWEEPQPDRLGSGDLPAVSGNQRARHPALPGHVESQAALAVRAAGPAELALQMSAAGMALQAHGRYAEAALQLRKALQVSLGQYGEYATLTARLRCDLGGALHALGDSAAARREYEQVLAHHWRNVHGDYLATTRALSGMGDLLRVGGEWTRALLYLHRALYRLRATVGDSPTTALTHTRLGAVYSDQGDHRQARRHFEQALEINTTTFGPRHAATAQGLHNLGLALFNLGRYQSARTHLERAVVLREDLLGTEHLATAQSLDALSNVFAHSQNYEQAVFCLERSAALYRQQLGVQHALTIGALRRLRTWSRETKGR